MSTPEDPQRRFAILAVLLLPWLMLFLAGDWTVTPIGMVDAWIYRALGRDLVQANQTLGDYYYAARPFVLVPRYLLSRFLLEGVAHAVYGLLCAHVLLFAVLDFLTSVARRSTWLLGVLLFGTCMYLLRSLGWGYVDGSILTWFMVGLAGVARWYRPGATSGARRGAALVAGGCFVAMLTTHPMALPMLATPLGLIVWLQRRKRPARGWLIWLELAMGGAGAVLLMGLVCEALYGRFLFFMPVVDAAMAISGTTWKHPPQEWIAEANWLVIIGFATLGAIAVLAGARLRRVRLTSFERYASLNLLGLTTLMVVLELATSAYWLEYPWFVSYFLPSALLGLAAMLGERTKGLADPRARWALLAVFVGFAAVGYRLVAESILPRDPFGNAVPWLGSIPLAALQAGVAFLALAVMLVSVRSVRRPGARALLLAAPLIAIVLGAPTNPVGPGEERAAAAEAAVAHAIVLIQDELQGRRPAYWYDGANPLARLFVTISSGHLAYYSQLREAYPRGAAATRGKPDGERLFFETGDPVIILDEDASRFPRAQQSFAELGIALTETRRVPLQILGRSYVLIFATLEPGLIRLQPGELLTDLKRAVMTDDGRVSERELGYLAYGPYVRLSPGLHRVTFHLRVLDAPSDDFLGSVEVIDVYGKTPRTFQIKRLLASEALSNGALDPTLEFTVPEEISSGEFRVRAQGTARLALRSVEVQRPEGTRIAVSERGLAAATRSLGNGGSEAVSPTDLLGAPFAFVAPAPGSPFPRTLKLNVRWSASGASGRLRLTASGSCIEPVEVEVDPAIGSHTLEPFRPVEGSAGASCNVVISLVRTRKGTADPAWAPADDVEASVSRSVTITSTP